MARNGRLSARQQRAITALMTAGTVTRAAKICEVSERQMYRWLELPEFRAALVKASEDAIQATVRQLSDLVGIAVIALRKVLTNQDAPFGAQVRAADVVLSRLMNLKELADLEKRVAALETKNESQKAG